MNIFNREDIQYCQIQKINKQTPPSKKVNSIFFPVIWNKQMVQYSCFFFELLRDALDFNDFEERKGGKIIAPPNSPFLSQVNDHQGLCSLGLYIHA
uniref:Uncharacterized protein n=1 Tax=Serinus canaria TaxID=9135 RepID=A0A8C9UEQ3_SERCA